MKNCLLLVITTLFFVEEPSYNFGGRYTKEGTVTLTIDVRDGSYWATFTDKNVNDSTACTFSEKARVKNGTLHIYSKQLNQPFTLIISSVDHTKKMVVRGLRKGDQYSLMHFCNNGSSLAGDYNRLP